MNVDQQFLHESRRFYASLGVEHDKQTLARPMADQAIDDDEQLALKFRREVHAKYGYTFHKAEAQYKEFLNVWDVTVPGDRRVRVILLGFASYAQDATQVSHLRALATAVQYAQSKGWKTIVCQFHHVLYKVRLMNLSQYRQHVLATRRCMKQRPTVAVLEIPDDFWYAYNRDFSRQLNQEHDAWTRSIREDVLL